MKKITFIIPLLMLLFCSHISFAQTALKAGDIVITGYNADIGGNTEGGEISFLLLKPANR